MIYDFSMSKLYQFFPAAGRWPLADPFFISTIHASEALRKKAFVYRKRSFND